MKLTLSKILAIFITLISGLLIVHTWGTPLVMGWVVAFSGWSGHIFDR